MIRVLFAAMIALLAGLIVYDYFRERIYFEPILVPKSLSDRGYSPEVITLHLVDRIKNIRQDYLLIPGVLRTSQSLGRESLLPNSNIDLKIPGVDVSLLSILGAVKSYLGLPETRISGEIVCKKDNCLPGELRLRLRVAKRPAPNQYITLPDDREALLDDCDILPDVRRAQIENIDHLIEVASRELLRIYDPYLFAARISTSKAQTCKKRAIETILSVLQRGAGAEKVKAYILWGNILARQNRFTEAISKYESALQHYRRLAHPNAPSKSIYAMALNNWGRALIDLGDVEPGLDKLEKAARIDAAYASADYNLGVAYFYAGAFDKAEKAFDAYLSGTDEDLDKEGRSYALLWQYLAQARTRETATVPANNLDLDAWPVPVLKLFAGNSTPEEVLEAAREDERHRRNRECEAHFYIAEYYLAKGATERAATHFTRSLSYKELSFFEFDERLAAKVELERMDCTGPC